MTPNHSQAYVREANGRLALYRQAANARYWDQVWYDIPDTQLYHILRSTRRLGTHRSFFQRWLPHNEIILEAGCGTGLWVRRLRENGWHCIGLDYVLSSLRRSKTVYPPLPLIGGNVLQLPFADNSLGGYISFGVVEHFPEGPYSILVECTRVLRPGGVALISVPYDSPMRGTLRSIHPEEAKHQGLDFYQYYFTREDFQNELLIAGLKPTTAFHGYGVNSGLTGRYKWLASYLGRFSSLLDFIPGLSHLSAHMMFMVGIKA